MENTPETYTKLKSYVKNYPVGNHMIVYEGEPTYVQSTTGDYWAPGGYEYEILGQAIHFKGSAKDSLMEIK